MAAMPPPEPVEGTARTAILNRLGTSKAKRLILELKRQLKAVERAVANLDIAIKRADKPAIPSSPGVLMFSPRLPGAGPVAAIARIAGLHAIGALSAKQAAMIAGLAPIAGDSGEPNGARHIRGGRADLRKALSMAAVSAARFNPALNLFYSRRIGAGKKPKVGLAAVIRKLVVLAGALPREDRPWQPNHP